MNSKFMIQIITFPAKVTIEEDDRLNEGIRTKSTYKQAHNHNMRHVPNWNIDLFFRNYHILTEHILSTNTGCTLTDNCSSHIQVLVWSSNWYHLTLR